jgi:hypothetical protein
MIHFFTPASSLLSIRGMGFEVRDQIQTSRSTLRGNTLFIYKSSGDYQDLVTAAFSF